MPELIILNDVCNKRLHIYNMLVKNAAKVSLDFAAFDLLNCFEKFRLHGMKTIEKVIPHFF